MGNTDRRGIRGDDRRHGGEYPPLQPHDDACDDRASTAYFQQQIAAFTTAYYDLLGNLATLPQHPRVLINEYYNPFGEKLDCLKKQNITAAKAKILQSRLDELNSVLRQGAQTFNFTAVPQHFDGHRLCSDQPFVQGPDANAPLHPNAAGELAIALASMPEPPLVERETAGRSPSGFLTTRRSRRRARTWTSLRTAAAPPRRRCGCMSRRSRPRICP